jgi:transcriptional regulator with XRE-family HTH domain
VPKKPPPVDPVVDFGRRVRAVRQAHGWTLEELAERCGLHWTYVGQVERGKRNVTLRNIVKLAEALGVEPGELLDGLSAQ